MTLRFLIREIRVVGTYFLQNKCDRLLYEKKKKKFNFPTTHNVEASCIAIIIKLYIQSKIKFETYLNSFEYIVISDDGDRYLALLTYMIPDIST